MADLPKLLFPDGSYRPMTREEEEALRERMVNPRVCENTLHLVSSGVVKANTQNRAARRKAARKRK